jgi:hypothetical protein
LKLFNFFLEDGNLKFGVRAHDYGKYDAKILAEKIRETGFEAVHLAVKNLCRE